MFDALDSCKEHILQFGGHSQAAGLSFNKDQLPFIKEKLEKRIKELLKPEDLRQKLIIDAEAKLFDFNQKFIADLKHLEPFGCENQQPLFVMHDVVLVQKPHLLKEAHVKCAIFA